MDPFAWPAAVVVITIFFMVMFRHPIEALIGRTKKFGKAGLETHDHAQLPAADEGKQALAEFMGTFDNPLLTEQEAVKAI